MYIAKKFVFIELHKTGCTHILKLLSQFFNGEVIGKHNSASVQLINSGRSFIGSIRNPWDWYVSLWAYGCDKRGGLYDNLTNPNMHSYERASKWNRLYSNVHDANAFKEWLSCIHNEAYFHDVGEGYSLSSISQTSGLLTYRFIKLFCKNVNNMKDLNFANIKDLQKFESYNNYIDFYIRNENLENDLINTLELCGYTLSSTMKEEILSSGRTNISSRVKGVDYYYDDESYNLVCNKEKFIINKFNYI